MEKDKLVVGCRSLALIRLVWRKRNSKILRQKFDFVYMRKNLLFGASMRFYLYRKLHFFVEKYIFTWTLYFQVYLMSSSLLIKIHFT